MNENLESDRRIDSSRTTGSSGLNTSFSVADDKKFTLQDMLLDHPLVTEALTLLSQKLPRDLKYHNFQHTVEVLSRTVELAKLDGCSADDITLLAIAAAWHDVGFIKQNTQNEPIAAQMVREAMLRNGDFSEQDIAEVEAAILDTQIKFDVKHKTLFQKSTARLSPWLLDADLSNFGQKDFMNKSMAVYAELSGKSVENPSDLKDPSGQAYICSTVRLIANHSWHSQAARTLYQQQERVNLADLGLLLAEILDGTDSGLQNAWSRLHERADLLT